MEDYPGVSQKQDEPLGLSKRKNISASSEIV